MAPKHKHCEEKIPSKAKDVAGASYLKPDISSTRRKSKKPLRFRIDEDDDTPIAGLLHKLPTSSTPNTPIKHESASTQAKALSLPAAISTTKKIQKKTKHHKHKTGKITLRKGSCLPTSSEKPKDQEVSILPQFTTFGSMTQENNTYSVHIKVIHYWYINSSPIGTSLTGFLVIKDKENSLMQVIIPEFDIDKWKSTFIRGIGFEIRNVVIFKSTRKTKLVDAHFELHFTDTTTAVQLEDLLIDLGPLYNFESLAKIPSFLPPGDITTQLCVRDTIAIVVDLTPLLKRVRRGKIINFFEAYITDPTRSA